MQEESTPRARLTEDAPGHEWTVDVHSNRFYVLTAEDPGTTPADAAPAAELPALKHPDAEIYHSMPGIAEITGARVLAEFGDDPDRYASAKARKKLRRHQPRHPGLRQESHRPGPLRP